MPTNSDHPVSDRADTLPSIAGPVLGLCSVSFRHLGAAEVLEMMTETALSTIEWGADVHVPPDAPAGQVERLSASSAERDVSVASYGSYFRADEEDGFVPVLATARRLGAPRIRVWAGSTGSVEVNSMRRARTVAVLRECARAAAKCGIRIGLEFHSGTLTDTVESTERLLDEVGHDNLQTYWQPPVGASDAEAIAGLDRLADRVCAVHAFSWRADATRMPLSGRASLWRAVLARLSSRGAATDVLLEFVADDTPENLRTDAATLRELANEAWR